MLTMLLLYIFMGWYEIGNQSSDFKYNRSFQWSANLGQSKSFLGLYELIRKNYYRRTGLQA